ncbi:hypothetical protein [Sphingomonas sp. PR090111-T3T-6A]|uniref:hypothetical protein n=1 Tax=Sphingomonas sp. PR090111-T3T-6A TaxID=685778 RepID=UPI000362C495|nr:hypothetical protein [Sphingomonas sp. PR090111-T3T-6A]
MAKGVIKLKAALPTSDWVFENNPPMGGATGEAFTNTLASSGMAPASVLAREAIQNSVDAHAEGEQKVRVEFVAKAITGKDKTAFVAAAGLTAIAQREAKLGFKEPNCIADLQNGKKPMTLLFVNDYNTTGLAGDPSDTDSKFARFLLSLGDGGKEHTEHGTGGSYGFGKSVYSSNSAILTIYAYSRTSDGDGNPTSILFGCGYYRKHKHDDAGFTGRAWFGRDVTEDGPNAHQIVEPLRDDEADAHAAKLGFDVRGDEDFGTSVLIVDAAVDAAGILRGIEDWWWPRLLSNLLDIRVVDTKGDISFPRPRKREDLKPFLEAFETAIGKSPPDGRRTFHRPFNKSEGTNIGTSGFVVLERDEKDNPLVDEDHVDAVALIRSPLMVVAYYRQWSVGTPAMAGAFLGAEDIDDILRAAEPPAHDRWDRNARRLQDQTGRKREIVNKVLSGVRRAIKQCQGTASPPPPPRPKRLSVLERTLANFLTPTKKGPQPNPEPSSAPIHLTYDQEPRASAEGNSLRLKASFDVKLKSEENVDSLKARVRVTCPVIEDGAVGDSLEVAVTANVELTEDETRPGWKVFDLTQADGAHFDCETGAYDPLWTVRFVPEVEPVEIEQ